MGESAAGHLPVMIDQVLALFAPALQPAARSWSTPPSAGPGTPARCWTRIPGWR